MWALVCERRTKDVVVDGWNACTGDDLGLLMSLHDTKRSTLHCHDKDLAVFDEGQEQ